MTMTKREKSMLEKSIGMSIDITEDYAAKALGFVFFGSVMTGILTIPAFIVALVYAFLGFRQLFDKSLYGEEAYTYMLAPMSMKHIIIGKTIAACFWLTFGVMLIYIGLCISGLLFQTFSMDWSIGAFLLQEVSGVLDAVENGVIGRNEIVYDRGDLMCLAAGEILVPVVALSESILVCGLFQLGYAVRHVLAPNRDKPMVTVMIVLGGAVVLALALAVFGGLAVLIYGHDVTGWMAPELLEIPVLGGCGIGLLVIGIKLLERKYNLC